MPLFKYKAMTEVGKKVQGEFTANNKNEVIAMIRENRFFPISVEEKNKSKEINFGQFLSKVKTKDLAIFCRQFSSLLDAGSDILNSIDLLKKQTENKKMQSSLEEIHEEIQKGYTLSEAMSKFKDIYPSLLVNMIESGEETGQLSLIMERMADQYERENKINSKIRGALTYPIILIFVSIIMVTFLLTFIMPTFVGMFESSGVELPGPTKAVMTMSNGIKNYWYLIIIFIVLLIGGIKNFVKTEKGSKGIDGLKLKFPGLQKTTKKIITMRFARGLSTTLYSGISMIKAIEIVSKIVGNKLIELKLMNAREKVIKGIMLNEALQDIKEFPLMLIAMVKIGEESGSIDNILEKTAQFYEQEVEESLQRMTTLIEPILILIMGLLVGFIVIAMAMPMFDMFKTVG